MPPVRGFFVSWRRAGGGPDARSGPRRRSVRRPAVCLADHVVDQVLLHHAAHAARARAIGVERDILARMRFRAQGDQRLLMRHHPGFGGRSAGARIVQGPNMPFVRPGYTAISPSQRDLLRLANVANRLSGISLGISCILALQAIRSCESPINAT